LSERAWPSRFRPYLQNGVQFRTISNICWRARAISIAATDWLAGGNDCKKSRALGAPMTIER
jgi:hypothetical protein